MSSESTRTEGGAGTSRRPRATTGRILRTVGVVAVVVHAAQTFGGSSPWIAVAAFALAAAFVVGWRLDVLRSVRTAVVLMVLLSGACTLGTLTVQRAHLGRVSDEDYLSTLSFAWAHLWIKVTHPLPGKPALPPEQEAHLQRMAVAFGDDVADEERAAALKGASSFRDEQRARELALSRPGLFRALHAVARSLRLTDLHRAWWFVALFYLLGANLVAGALLRRRLSVRNAGFHAAHAGLVLVIAGATVGAFVARRGVMPLTVGGASSSYVIQDSMAAVPLDFQVTLQRFDTLYHEDLTIELLPRSDDPHHGMGGGPMGGGGDSLRHRVKLERGKEITLTEPDTGRRYRVTLLDIASASSLRRSFGPAAPGGGAPAARLRLPWPDDASTEVVWLGADDPLFVDPDNRFKLRVEAADALPDAPPAPSCATGAPPGTLVVTTAAGETALPVRVGETARVGSLEVTFQDVVPDFRVGGATGDPAAYPRNPALAARVLGDDGRGGDVFFFADPRLRGFTSLPFDGVEMAFDYDYWCTPTGTRVRLLVTPSGEAGAVVEDAEEALADEDAAVEVLADEDAAAPPQVVPLAPGSSLALPGVGSLVLEEVLGSGVERTELLVEGTEARHTALLLGVDGPDGSHGERWLLSNTADGALQLGDAGSGFLLTLGDNRQRPPRDWHSQLALSVDGETVRTADVQVNDPVLFRGHWLYQSDADPQRPDYSGLQVLFDPSWPLVKLGLWMLMLGVAWCFYVQPLIDRRSARARAAGGPAR